MLPFRHLIVTLRWSSLVGWLATKQGGVSHFIGLREKGLLEYTGLVYSGGVVLPRCSKEKTEKKPMIRNKICLLALCGLIALSAASVRADDSALLDVLVKKGILTKQEAEKLEAEVGKEPVAQPQGLAANIKIGDWVQELDLYGDMRFREYWSNFENQLPTPPQKVTTAYDKNIQRQRLRFRLRLDADFKLADNFFGGFQLSTSDNRGGTTTNATYTGGTDNYNIYISRAFMGWAPIDGLTFVIGKQNNPFYTTELNWAPDVGPSGIVERIDFHRLFGWGSGGEPAGYSKEGKAPPPEVAPTPFPLELSLIAGQFIFFNNNADSSISFDKTDAFFFDTQLLAKIHLLHNQVTVTFGPQVQIWNEAGLGPTAVLNKTTVTNPVNNPTGSAIGFPDQSTAPTGGTGTGTLGTLNDAIPFPIYTRDEFFLQAPGDISFKLAGIPISFYWDTSYNVWGPERFNEVYGPLFDTVTYTKSATGTATPHFSGLIHPTFQDYFAWLAGVKIGQNKKKGDISLLVDYRQIGLAAVDPNINTDDFNLSYLNAAGWRASVAFNLTDFAVLQVTGWFSNNLVRNLYGGFATQGTYAQALPNSSQVLAVDLAFRF
ncbi:MAG: putative porin [Verrucomicrobia bacterium]|nr:putative porin [Verrucomicrobiota bacterium]